jgi:hypothetical protein
MTKNKKQNKEQKKEKKIEVYLFFLNFKAASNQTKIKKFFLIILITKHIRKTTFKRKMK